MKLPIQYFPNFITNHEELFQTLWMTLPWHHAGEKVPRLEYYCNDFAVPYTYGTGDFSRRYDPQPYTPEILKIRNELEDFSSEIFEVCFLNGYRDGKDQLGWHSDDSPEMDDERSIAIISLGAKREIYFVEKDETGKRIGETEKLWLEPGSLCIMKPGMQDTHYHRIPKSSISDCGPRISLTFRGYIKGE